jgi:hypothetical protein
VVAAVALTVAVLLGAIGTGQARPKGAGKPEVEPARTAGFWLLGKKGGYRVALSMPNDRVVLLYEIRIERRKHDFSSFSYSIYAVHNLGDLEQGVVRARFGSLGRVALRFRPDGRIRKRSTSPECEGGPTVTEYGSFVGRLSFRGKGNYLDVSSTGGEGTLARSPRLRCEKGQETEALPKSLRKYVAPTPVFPDRQSIALLYASSRAHGRYVGLTAVHLEGSPPGADVQLGIVENEHGMAIGHGVFVNGSAGTLLTSLPGTHPATATLTLPLPFSGRASYSEASDAWTGRLVVKLAGMTLPLTGPGFHVHLCVANPLRDKDRCEFFKAETPPEERSARPGWALR